jgi:hypothetical protein
MNNSMKSTFIYIIRPNLCYILLISLLTVTKKKANITEFLITFSMSPMFTTKEPYSGSALIQLPSFVLTCKAPLVLSFIN